jgi:hypothetical protein
MATNKRMLTPEEIQTLHSEVQTYVQDNWQDAQNPDIRIQDYGAVDIGLEAMTCNLLDYTTIRSSLLDGLKKRFPGADYHTEMTPNGSAYTRLEIPIWVEDVYNGRSNAKYARRSAPGEPSTVTGVFLGMSNLLIWTILYFRLIAN